MKKKEYRAEMDHYILRIATDHELQELCLELTAKMSIKKIKKILRKAYE